MDNYFGMTRENRDMQDIKDTVTQTREWIHVSQNVYFFNGVK